MKLIFLILSLWFGACAVHASQPIEMLKERINAAHTPTEVLDTYLEMLPEFAPRERIPIAGYLYTFIVTGETIFVPKKKFKISRGAHQDKKQKVFDALVRAAYYYKSTEKIRINPKNIANRAHAALCEKVFTQARDYFSTYPPLSIDIFTPSEQRILESLMGRPLSAHVLTDYYDDVESRIEHPTAVIVSLATPKAPPPPAPPPPPPVYAQSISQQQTGLSRTIVKRKKTKNAAETMQQTEKGGELFGESLKKAITGRRVNADGTQSESDDGSGWTTDEETDEETEESRKKKELRRQKQDERKINQVQRKQEQVEAASRRKEELEKQRQAQEKEAKEKAALVAAQATKPPSVKMVGDATKPRDLPTIPKEKPNTTEAPAPPKSRIQIAKEALEKEPQEKKKALEAQKAQSAEQRKLAFKKHLQPPQ